MKIKMLETVLSHGERFEEGETRSVSQETGAHFCDMGWAEDIDGQVKTGTRDIHRTKRLDVASGVLGNKTQELN